MALSVGAQERNMLFFSFQSRFHHQEMKPDSPKWLIVKLFRDRVSS